MAKILVTGGNGFLGKHLVSRLRENGHETYVPSHSWFDLRDSHRVEALYEEVKPSVVIHAAALCGGIQVCSDNPGSFLYDNLKMGLEVMEGARIHKVKKFVLISSVCAYPLQVSLPAKEEELWRGYPEETNAPYGLAKRVLISQAQAYRKQYGLNAISLIPANMYGPGDKFELATAHVIPSLIRRFVEAKGDVMVWGSGSVSREFLYVEDCADAIVKATELYDKPEPVNIGTGKETTIKELVEEIVKATDFKGNVVWDSTKPEGQPRRLFDVSRAEKEFGFKANVGLKDGIKRTVAWFLKNNV